MAGLYGKGNIGSLRSDVYVLPKNTKTKDTSKYKRGIRKSVFVTIGTAHLAVESQKLIPEKTSIGQRLEDVRLRRSTEDLIRGEQSNLKEGFVYLVVNTKWPEWVKVGMTIDYVSRLNVYNTGDPFRAYEFKMIEWVDNRRLAETKLLVEFEQESERKGEWFKLTIAEATHLFKRSLGSD